MEWISVKDKLPDLGYTVIVSWTNHVTVGYCHRDGNFYPAHPAPYTIPVTHWMALPDAPTSPEQVPESPQE